MHARRAATRAAIGMPRGGAGRSIRWWLCRGGLQGTRLKTAGPAQVWSFVALGRTSAPPHACVSLALYACHAPTVTHRARPTIRAVVDGGASSASFGVPSPEASATSAEGGVSSSAILGTALLGSAMKPSREGPPPALPPAVLLFRPSAPIAPPTRARDVPRIRRPRDVKLMLNPPGFAPVEAPGSLEATSRHVTLAPPLLSPPRYRRPHTHAHTCTHIQVHTRHVPHG